MSIERYEQTNTAGVKFQNTITIIPKDESVQQFTKNLAIFLILPMFQRLHHCKDHGIIKILLGARLCSEDFMGTGFFNSFNDLILNK